MTNNENMYIRLTASNYKKKFETLNSVERTFDYDREIGFCDIRFIKWKRHFQFNYTNEREGKGMEDTNEKLNRDECEKLNQEVIQETVRE